jgi:hypothetical protein
MGGKFATLAFVVLGCAATVAQAPPDRSRLTGNVYDRQDKYPIPGAEITVKQTGHTAISDERGAFAIADLPPGRYDVTASIAGFRTQSLQAVLPQPPGAQLEFFMRIGLIAETHWVPLAPREAFQHAKAIAHVRLEGLSSSKLKCADINALVAIHDATVISAWKGRLPATIQIVENDTGSCIEDDGSVTRYSKRSSYPAHTEYVVFLFGDASPYGRLGPAATAFRVDGSMVDNRGFFEDLPDSVELGAFRKRVIEADMRRQVAWLDEWQRQTALAPLQITGVVTDSAGHPLEGALVRIANRDAISARADVRGEFTIGGLAPGSYDVVAELQGFRRARVTVSLPKEAKQNLTLVMRVGLLVSPLYVLPDDDDAVRQATAIARVRLDGFATDQVNCDDLVVLAAPHNATVVDVWKGKLPRAIQIWEDGVGSCVESDGAVVKAASAVSRHLIGSEYVVLLTGSAPRFGGLGPGSRAFRIQGSLVETNGFLDLPATTELPLFKKRLEDLSR